MANFSFRKVDGRYYARISRKGADPPRKSWPLSTRQKSTAHTRLSRLQRAYDRGDWDPWNGGWLTPEPIPLPEAVELFLDAKSHLRPSTQKAYLGILRRFTESIRGPVMLQDVTPGDLRSYIRQSNLARASQRKRYRHLQAFFNWLVKDEHLSYSPLEEVEQRKKEQREAAYLDESDVERLLVAIDHHMETSVDAIGRSPDLGWLRAMIRVAVCTGLRRSALVALQWDDVSLERRSLHVRHRGDFRTKGNAERRVPIRGDAEEVMKELRAQLLDERGSITEKPQGTVFVDRRGLPIRPGRVTKRFKAMARLAGLDERIHFHSLRHTTGSWLSMRGVPMRHIQAILGHSDLSTTERYSHLAPETLDRAMDETFG